MARILDGKAIAANVRTGLKQDIDILKSQAIEPKLVVVLVGDNPASASYVRGKERMARELGIVAEVRRLPETVSEQTLIKEIEQLNADNQVDGILVQLPLPAHIQASHMLDIIHPDKDVDGFHPYNIGRYAGGSPLIWPCTPAGILTILQQSEIAIAGQTAVIVGRSQIVGWPTAQILLAQDATVIQCHSKTPNLAQFTTQGDILIVAVGKAGLIGAAEVKTGATVIDVGMNRVDGRLVGDVDYDAVVQKVDAITPVPGGVGPLTVTMLMKNTIQLAAARRGVVGDLR